MQETQAQSLGQEDPLEDMATHSSILALRIPWTEESGVVYRVAKELDMTEPLTHTHTELIYNVILFFNSI